MKPLKQKQMMRMGTNLISKSSNIIILRNINNSNNNDSCNMMLYDTGWGIPDMPGISDFFCQIGHLWYGFMSYVERGLSQREAIILEPLDAVVAQPTIPLVLTYHPNNTLVKSILTSNLHLL